jgi:amino acid adenylation domain-containing protein
MIINNIVLRNDLSGNPTVRDLLVRVRDTTLEACAHQDLPFDKVVEALQPKRELSHNPLFQVMFGFHDAPMSDIELPGLDVDLVLGLSNGSAKFDLNVIVIPDSNQRPGRSRGETQGLTLLWEYNSDLFEEATMRRMMGHYQTLLEAMVGNPGQGLSDLPMLTEAERQQLLVEWNDTKRDYPKDKCIHELFETQAETSPDAVAVVFEEQQLTYRELNTRANQLARYLRKLGVGPETLVGSCVERSLDMIVALLGILKSGGAYVPLDSEYPKERLALMLKDTQTKVLLTQERLIRSLPESRAQIVCLDSEWEKIAEESGDDQSSNTTAESLAYVIYTSGSTGIPKGVMISHGSIASHCTSIRSYYQLNSTDCVLQFASVNFDASLEQILAALICGARLLLRDNEIPSPVELQKKMYDFGLSVINLPTAYWHQLAQTAATTPDLFSRSKLRLVIVGGEEMLPELVRLWQKSPHREARLLNAYGPTEATITATAFEVSAACSNNLLSRTVPIGRSLGNRQLFVLDQHSNLVPIGVAGELHIGGGALARGYLNRPELTAEKFVPDTFSDEPGARLYKTGDLVRHRPSGDIEFLGRLDHQVKVRGFRIELGEIESALGQHPEIGIAVVLAREDATEEQHADQNRKSKIGNPKSDKRLVAYVVPRTELTCTTGELRRFLKQRLPEYMIPSAFVLVDTLPLTPNGKVDRKALPAPDQNRPEPEESYVAPRTPVEEMLAEIWADVLKLDKVGIYDNFFELGGHSLLATQLVSRLCSAFKVEVPLRALFESPTVAGLASQIVQQQATTHGAGELAEMLADVESLSDEEAKRRIAQEGSPTS